jgi:hypothetical protein
VSASASNLVQRPNGWMVQRDDVDPPQYLCKDGEWVLTTGMPTWFGDADTAQAAPLPAGTKGTVIQMWDANMSGAGEPQWRVERRRWPRVTMTYKRSS